MNFRAKNHIFPINILFGAEIQNSAETQFFTNLNFWTKKTRFQSSVTGPQFKANPVCT